VVVVHAGQGVHRVDPVGDEGGDRSFRRRHGLGWCGARLNHCGRRVCRSGPFCREAFRRIPLIALTKRDSRAPFARLLTSHPCTVTARIRAAHCAQPQSPL
jgi:hypothetical protein